MAGRFERMSGSCRRFSVLAITPRLTGNTICETETGRQVGGAPAGSAYRERTGATKRRKPANVSMAEVTVGPGGETCDSPQHRPLGRTQSDGEAGFLPPRPAMGPSSSTSLSYCGARTVVPESTAPGGSPMPTPANRPNRRITSAGSTCTPGRSPARMRRLGARSIAPLFVC